MQAAFHHIPIAHQRVGSAIVLDAIASGTGGRVFFSTGQDLLGLAPGQDTEFDTVQTLGDAMVVNTTGPKTPKLVLDGIEADLFLSQPECHWFEDLNTALAFRNGQTAKITLDWLRWHVDTQRLDAALIVDRARPNENRRYLDGLATGIETIPGLKQLVVVQFYAPLGQLDMPREHHPFSAPDAPGKDRMEVPPPDSWTSPLGQHGIFELLRHRFLNTARAVAQLDVTDLLMPSDISVFDRAQKRGVVALEGHHCYPWRVRPKDDAHFADHICRQFDASDTRARWCVAPKVTGENAVWRFTRIVGTPVDEAIPAPFMRFMGIRHPVKNVSRIVPKTSLIEDDLLLDLAQNHFNHKPVRMPVLESPTVDTSKNSVTIITTMKNEGPFILEWVAYHRAIGVENFLVYTNDCTDGTDEFHELLQSKGIVQHRDNPFRGSGLKPQHAALKAGEKEDVIKNADWVICMDVDEFINIRAGDGTLKALFDAVGDANMISLTWRLFGNADIHAFTDRPIIREFTRCAFEMTRTPHQAWGFKTLFRNIGLFKKLGVHRPKGLNQQLWKDVNWVNGSGKPIPREFFRNAWRSTQETVGYDLVSLNHYAVRSAESFLAKRARGRVNHANRDQGLAYWFRMNHNVSEDHSIQRMLPALNAEMDRLLSDPDIAAMHQKCVDAHRAKIEELKATEKYANFYEALTSERMQRLSKQLQHFGANVFLAGPDVVPDEVAFGDHPKRFYFNVERQETTAH